MALIPVIPAQNAKAAITARLSNGSTGFNNWAAVCLANGLVLPQISFAPNSQNFASGKYLFQQILDEEELDFPLVAMWQGPVTSVATTDRAYLVGQTFSGLVTIGIDIHLLSAEDQSQSDFDLLISGLHDTMINTMNCPAGQGDFTSRGIVWGQQIAMGQPSRLLIEETGRYASMMPFVLHLSSPNNYR